MSDQTPWSALGDRFLSEGEWSVGQGVDAPDRMLLREMLAARPETTKTTLLEVGCGPGIEVEGLARDGLLGKLLYRGLDFTPELVDACRRRYPHLTFDVRDVHDLAGERADVVWCRHLLEHVDDGELALRNLWAAAADVLLISWFIRPTWRPADAGCVVADGFQHWTYDARRWVALAGELGAHLYRFDLDHHESRGAVWILARHRDPELAAAIHAFVASERLVAAVAPVPPDRHESEDALLDVLEETHDAVGGVIPVVERVDELTRLLHEDGKALADTFEFLRTRTHLDPDIGELCGRVNEAKARTEAAYGGPSDAAEAVQATRDAHARVESALVQHGRRP